MLTKYFAYHVDLHGVALASYELQGSDDPAAVSEARSFLRFHPSLEIWQGGFRFPRRKSCGMRNSLGLKRSMECRMLDAALWCGVGLIRLPPGRLSTRFRLLPTFLTIFFTGHRPTAVSSSPRIGPRISVHQRHAPDLACGHGRSASLILRHVSLLKMFERPTA